MSDDENVGVMESEMVQQEIASPSETEDQHNEPMEAKPLHPKRKDVEYNWAQARREMQELKQRNLEYENELLRLKQSYQQKPEVDPLDNIADDDIVTRSQTERLIDKRAENKARKIVEEYMQQKEVETVEDRIKMKLPDFDDVVNEDAINSLKNQHPEIAESLHALRNNPYKQAKAVYDAVKAFVPRQNVQTGIEKKKAQDNSQKPISVQAAPKQSAIGQVHMFENGLTPEVKKQLWKEMQDASKRF